MPSFRYVIGGKEAPKQSLLHNYRPILLNLLTTIMKGIKSSASLVAFVLGTACLVAVWISDSNNVRKNTKSTLPGSVREAARLNPVEQKTVNISFTKYSLKVSSQKTASRGAVKQASKVSVSKDQPSKVPVSNNELPRTVRRRRPDRNNRNKRKQNKNKTNKNKKNKNEIVRFYYGARPPPSWSTFSNHSTAGGHFTLS